MLELLAVSEAARRKTAAAIDPKPSKPRVSQERPKRDAVRATSAAALRRLAERLEPSPTA